MAEGYKSYGLFLVQPILKLKDYTITDLTPSSTVRILLQQFGFKTLDSGINIILPGIVIRNNKENIFTAHEISEFSSHCFQKEIGKLLMTMHPIYANFTLSKTLNP